MQTGIIWRVHKLKFTFYVYKIHRSYITMEENVKLRYEMYNKY